MNRLNDTAAPRTYSHFRRVNGLIRHARVYPNADFGAPSIVIVPGLGCAAWMYRRLARRLAPELQVWVYDHHFTGRCRKVASDSEAVERLPAVDEFGEVHPSLSHRCSGGR